MTQNRILNLLHHPRVRQAAGSVGILTTIILLSAAGVLAYDLVAQVGAEAAAPVAASKSALHENASQGMYTMTIILALGVVAPLTFAGGLFVLVRRHTRRHGPLLRIEYGAPTTTVVGPFTASSLGFGPVAALEGERANRLEETTSSAQAVPLGPSFEEELRLRQGLARLQEKAVLEQLLSDNLKLQEQLEFDGEQRPQDPEATALDHAPLTM